jgi:ferredoxin-NADP reductase
MNRPLSGSLNIRLTTKSSIGLAVPHWSAISGLLMSYRCGIGIPPILPMIAAAERTGAAWRLFHGGRTRRGMAFLNALEAVSPNVRVVPQDENGLLVLAACLSGLTPGVLVYCCGPEPLLAAVESRCAIAAPGRLHRS